MDDQELLRKYVRENSDQAFQELVERHMDLVYSAAVRQVRDEHLARDITQEVFTALALKADKLADVSVLEGWLFRAVRFSALNMLRREHRQKHWIQEAARMENRIDTLDSESAWERLEPLLNDAIARLKEKDQNVLLLRYFKNQAFSEIAQRLGMSEEAAKKRAARSLEKLRNYLAHSGVATTAATLVALIPLKAVHAAPAGLSGSVATLAASKGLAANALTPMSLKGALEFMAWTKTKTAALAAIVLLLATGGGMVAYQSFHSAPKAIAGDKLGESFFKGSGEVTSSKIPPDVVAYLQAYLKEPQEVKKAVWPALGNYARAHQGFLPRALEDLKPFITNAPAEGLSLDRWQIVSSGALRALQPRQIILQKIELGPDGKPAAAINASGEIALDIPSLNGKGTYQITTD